MTRSGFVPRPLIAAATALVLSLVGLSTPAAAAPEPETAGPVLNSILIEAEISPAGEPRVWLDVVGEGQGTVQVTLESAGDGVQWLDETVDFDGWYASDWVAVEPGDLVAQAAVILEDGSTGQVIEETFTLEDLEPFTFSFSAVDDNADLVQLVAENNTGSFIQAQLVYEHCAGPRSYAETGLNPGSAITEIYDLTAISRVSISVAGDGFATWENTGPQACADTVPTISQDLWSTVRPAEGGSSALEQEISFRYASHSHGFELTVGIGSSQYDGSIVHHEAIPVDWVEEPGPVVTRTLPAEEATPYWTRAMYEFDYGFIRGQGMQTTATPPLTVEELTPGGWEEPPFLDVPEDDLFYTEITWAAKQGITTGWDDGTFRPSEGISRAAMAAFLYRYADVEGYEPPAESPFLDLRTDHLFYTEIAWLEEQNVTEGWPDGTFRPSDEISRAAMAAFVYRFAGEPEFTPPAVSPFPDVSTGHQFYTEITWLEELGITEGWPDGTFRPSDEISRAAMAAFLYRYDHLED